jgi:hypothetical protein
VFLASNTFVNDYGSGKFVSVSGATLVAHNNLFIGAGTLSTSGMLSADNLTGDPRFVDRAQYDYHLLEGSPAIGKAVDPGMADQFSLKPVSAYAHPLLEVARSEVDDVGAYEFSQQQVTMPAAGGGGSAGRPAADGGGAGAAGQVAAGSRAMQGAGAGGNAGRGVVAGAGGAGASGGAGAGDGSPAASAAKSSGCGCQLSPSPSYSLLEPSVLGIWFSWGVARRSERRRRRSRVHGPRRAV